MSRDSLAALRLPAVRAYAVGRIVAVFGAQMLDVAVGWQLYQRTGSAFSLGLVGLVQVVPVVLLALPAGAAADRLDRRRLALFAQLGLASCAAGLGLVAAFGGPTWAIYALLLGTGSFGTFFRPAAASLLTQIVPREQFVNANAWLSSGQQLGATAGPALGGLCLAGLGAAAVYWIDALAALVFVAALWALPRWLPPGRPFTAARAQDRGGATVGAAGEESLSAGVRFVFRTRLLLAPITLDLFAVFLGGATALLPVFAKDILEVGPAGLGALRAAPSVGAFLAAVLQAHLPPWRRTGRVLLGCVTVFGLATIGFGLSRWFPLSLACLAVLGGFDNVSAVIRTTLEQVVTPDRLRGRVAAIHWVFIGLSNELGEFESGLAAWAFGTVPAVVGGGVGTLLVVVAAAWAWPELRRLGRIEEAAARPG